MKQNTADPRVVRTRTLIQEAFFSLALEKNFETITVKDITEKASINRATFYAHYDDKYALLDNLIVDAFEDTMPENILLCNDFSGELIRELILFNCEYQVKFFDTCRISSKSIAAFVESIFEREMYELIYSILCRIYGGEHGTERLQMIASMITSTLQGVSRHWYVNQKQSSMDLVVKEASLFLMSGLEILFE